MRGQPVPVPVQIIAHRVQLRQTANVNQPVIVPVIVNHRPPLQRRRQAGVADQRIIAVRAARAEVPRIIPARYAVQVEVPVVESGGAGGGIVGGAFQRRGGLGGAGAGAGNAGRVAVPVAVADAGRVAVDARQPAPGGGAAGGDRADGIAGGDGGAGAGAVGAYQPAAIGVGAGDSHGAGGVAGIDAARVVPDQPAGPGAGAGGADGHAGVTGVDDALAARDDVAPHQAANIGGRLGDLNRPAGGAGGYGAAINPRQQPNLQVGQAGTRHVDAGVGGAAGHSDPGDDAAAAHRPEQTQLSGNPGGVRGNNDEEVFNDALVALKPPRVTRGGAGVGANGNPAGPGAGGGDVIVARGGQIIAGLNHPVVVDIKVQVGVQFVPDAGIRTAHPRLHPGKRLLIPHRRRPRGAAPVAVQIVTQGGQLQQTGNVNQVVIVPVVVHLGRNRRPLRRNARPRVELQYRIIRTRPKVPRVIRPVGEDIVAVGIVHINVPAHKDVAAGTAVCGGAGQVAGGFPLRHIGVPVVRNGAGGGVPVTGGYGGAGADIANQPANHRSGARTGGRPGGIAGGYGNAVAHDRANQPAHLGTGPAGRYIPRGVSSEYRALIIAGNALHTARQAARYVRVG